MCVVQILEVCDFTWLLTFDLRSGDGRLPDVCLIDALRAHGFKIPYSAPGPFRAMGDGDQFLKPWGRLVCSQ